MLEQFYDRIWIQHKNFTRNGRFDTGRTKRKWNFVILCYCNVTLISPLKAYYYTLLNAYRKIMIFLNYTYLRAPSAPLSFNLTAITIGDIFIRVLAIASTVRRWHFANLRRSYYRIDFSSQQPGSGRSLLQREMFTHPSLLNCVTEST